MCTLGPERKGYVDFHGRLHSSPKLLLTFDTGRVGNFEAIFIGEIRRVVKLGVVVGLLKDCARKRETAINRR